MKYIDDYIEDHLVGETKQVVIEFIDFLNKNNIEYYRDFWIWKR